MDLNFIEDDNDNNDNNENNENNNLSIEKKLKTNSLNLGNQILAFTQKGNIILLTAERKTAYRLPEEPKDIRKNTKISWNPIVEVIEGDQDAIKAYEYRLSGIYWHQCYIDRERFKFKIREIERKICKVLEQKIRASYNGEIPSSIALRVLNIEQKLERFRRKVRTTYQENNKPTLISISEIHKEALEMGISMEESIIILCEMLITLSDFVNEVSISKPIFVVFTENNLSAQLTLIKTIEKIVSCDQSMIDNISGIFNMLYIEDIVSEDAFLEWNADENTIQNTIQLNEIQQDLEIHKFQNEIKNEIKKKAYPFIHWLQTAEEDSDSNSDSDSSN